MEKRDEKKVGIKNNKRGYWKTILWTIIIVSFVFLFILPLVFSSFIDTEKGNVAIIPINGVITADGEDYLGRETATSQDIIELIEKAEKEPKIEAIVLEINSPGGSPVASDEIGSAVKKIRKAGKPVVAIIRDVGASGGYWVASATDHIIANRMSITGSIGVLSSYLEFSGLMEKYGVGYEKLVGGKYKDLGTPYRKLAPEEEKIIQGKIDKLHDIFIKEVALNRHLEESKVRTMATGEFFLGVEALDLGLVDELGNLDTAKEYLQIVQGIKKIETVRYEAESSFLKLLTKLWADFPFKIGTGIGSIVMEKESKIMLM